MAPGPTSNYCNGPSLLCTCLVYFLLTIEFEHCSLSQNIIFKVACLITIRKMILITMIYFRKAQVY